ncbi:hypothetical protein AN619_03320 [Thermotalea metallivorans]|uniref:Uncharacterized protein n=1 Tax=Thermotalea metallivorans TaxID=520762 RepID=A0A140LBF3_9FIRM|nr:hypothetical protein AN619_03320 [Thermotalea metallivorans]
MCKEGSEILRDVQEDLTDLVKQFIKFADVLLHEGRITREQYENLTRTKIEFLNRSNDKTAQEKLLEIMTK